MALSKGFVGGWTSAFKDVILAEVLHAVAGIPVFGVKPFAGLQAWSDALMQQAASAFSTAQTAQASAYTANTKTQQITDGISAGVGSTTTGNDVSTVSTNIGSINSATQSVGTQVNSIVQALAQPGYPLWWTAGDPTAEVSFPYVLLSALSNHNHSVTVNGTASEGGTVTASGVTAGASIPFLSVYNTNAFMAFVRFQTAASRVAISFQAQLQQSTNYQLYVDVYQLNTDGSLTLNQSTGDLSGQITTSNFNWITTNLTNPLVVNAGSVYAFNFRLNGPAVVYVAGLAGFEPANFLGSRPYSFGATWAPSGNNSTAVQSFNQTTADSMYSGQVPFISVGMKPIPQQLYWYDDFNRSSLGSAYRVNGNNNNGYPIIYQNTLGYSGATNGVQVALYYQPAYTDKLGAGFDIPSNAGATQVGSGVGIGCDGAANGGAWLNIDNTRVAICSGGFGNQQAVATVSPPADTRGHWTFSYDPSSNTYTITKDGNVFGTWVDSNNVFTHGPSYRNGAIFQQHYSSTNSSVLDNFSFYDA